jgi:hypothetical protein
MGGHGENMIGEHCRIRQDLKEILLKDGIRNMRVLDTLGTLTSKSTVSEQLAALRPLVARDNVHLTALGNKALAEGKSKTLGFQKARESTPSRVCNWSKLPNGTGL